MSRQRVYIASAAANAPAARELAATLRAGGHSVVSDWHDVPGVEERRVREHALSHGEKHRIARRCVAQVRQATVVVVLAHPEMRGGLVEVGVAIGSCIPVEWRGGESTLFASLAFPVLGAVS